MGASVVFGGYIEHAWTQMGRCDKMAGNSRNPWLNANAFLDESRYAHVATMVDRLYQRSFLITHITFAFRQSPEDQASTIWKDPLAMLGDLSCQKRAWCTSISTYTVSHALVLFWTKCVPSWQAHFVYLESYTCQVGVHQRGHPSTVCPEELYFGL